MAGLPVNVEDIDVICSQLPQAIAHRHVHALSRGSGEVALHGLVFSVICAVPSTVFCCDDHLVSDTSGIHPFPNQLLRFLGVVRVGSVDEVSAKSEELVEKSKGIFTLSKELAPRISKADASEGDG